MRFHPKRTPVLCVEPDDSDCDRVVVHDLSRNTASMTVLAFLATCTRTPDTVVFTDWIAQLPGPTPPAAQKPEPSST